MCAFGIILSIAKIDKKKKKKNHLKTADDNTASVCFWFFPLYLLIFLLNQVTHAEPTST